MTRVVPNDAYPAEALRKQSTMASIKVTHKQHSLKDGDIQNKADVEAHINRLLGKPDGASPALEYVFVENARPDFALLPRWLGEWGVGFGHAAVAYTMADGKRTLVNITRGTGNVGEGELVEFWERPYDYIFGVHGAKGKGGLFSRSMCIVRVQEWDPAGVEAIDLYLRSMLASFQVSRASWHHCGMCINLLSWLGPGRVRPSGEWLQMPRVRTALPLPATAMPN